MSTNDQQGPQPKRRGRPSTGKRGTFSFRVTDSLRAKLEAASAESGRPVSEEIELRLEATFREPSPHSVPLLGIISSTIGLVETIMKKRWIDERAVALEAKQAIFELLNRFMAKSATTEREMTIDLLMAPSYRQGVGSFGRGLVEITASAGTKEIPSIDAFSAMLATMQRSDPDKFGPWFDGFLESLESEERARKAHASTEEH